MPPATPQHLPPSWTKQDTIDYLAENPLPVDFEWFHRDKGPDGKPKLAVVMPKYSLHGGYGKWLHDTPYFPGLFELIHDLLFHAGAGLPDIETITRQLVAIRTERLGQGDLF